MKKRSAWIASLFGAVGGGLGFLYAGKLRWAIAWPFLSILMVGTIARSRFVFKPWGMVVLGLIAGGIWLAGVVIPALVAHRLEMTELRPWQRWYVYLGFFLTVTVIQGTIKEMRGPWFGFETFRIPTGSMRDTLVHGDFIITDDWAYTSGRTPRRGDIVVYRTGDGASDVFVRRVIGLPGETLELKRGVVYINDVPLSEPYVAAANNARTAQQDLRFEVPQGTYFVLGDARDGSNDSRYMGPIAAENVLGRAEMIWMSWDKGMRRDRVGLRLYQ